MNVFRVQLVRERGLSGRRHGGQLKPERQGVGASVGAGGRGTTLGECGSGRAAGVEPLAWLFGQLFTERIVDVAEVGRDKRHTRRR